MSLRTKILLPLAIFSALLIAYIYGYYIPGSRAYMETEYRQSVERHLDTVVEGVIPLLLGRQLDAVYEYLDVLKKRNKDWVTIELIDPVGRTIYPLQAPGTTLKSGSEGQVHAVRRRIEYLNMDLGTIVLNVDFAPRVSDMRKRHRNLAAALFTIIFAFMMTAVIIVELVVRRPVNLLARASERLAEGDFNVPLVKTGNDEVGVLVDSFGRMRNAIQENQAELLRKSYVIMRSERKLEEAQRIAHLGSWELDLTNNKLLWSDEIYRIFGMEPQAFGATYEAFLETIHPDDRADVDTAYTVSLRDGSPYDIVHRIVRKADHETRYVHERCEHVKDDSGRIIRSLGTVQDITEHKRAEEALRLREAELNESQRLAHIGSWDWDAVNDIIWWSDEYYRIYGFDPKTPPPNYEEHKKAYTAESAERLDSAVKRAMESGEPYEVDLELAHPTASTQWVTARCEAKRDANGKIWGLRGTAQNITERKHAHQEIQRAKEDLELRVKERTADSQKKSAELQENQIALLNIVEDLNDKTAELESANARLHELDQLKSMFIASMSHELRTPLNSIIGFSSIMLNEWTGPLTAEQKENLAAVLRAGKHLLSLINDVIDVSKIEAGKIESIAEDFDVSEVVMEAVEALKKDIEKKGLALEVRTPRRVLHTDRRRLLQCLLNLLSNAMKYTMEGSIGVSAEISTDGSMMLMTVEDTGIGIREDDLGRLFLPFVRLNPPPGSIVPGTGLGLYLTRKLVQDIMKGDILVSSTYGAGSRFTLRVPVAG